MSAENEKRPPGFMSYFDDLDSFLPELSDSQKGELYSALHAYAKDKQPYTGGDIVVKMAFNAMARKIDKDQGKYNQRSKQNSINAKKRTANQPGSTIQPQAIASDGKPLQAIASDGKPLQTMAANNNSNSNSNSNGNSKQSSTNKAQNDIDNRFNVFYQAYPRHEGKQAAQKAFHKLKPSEELLSIMLKAIERQKQSSQWQDKRFIPNPASWINGRRWEDETIVAPPHQGRQVAAQNYEQRDYSQRPQTQMPDWMIEGMKELEHVEV